MWAAHGTIGAAVSVAWLLALYDSPVLEDRFTTVAVWIAFSLGSAAIVECLLRTSLVQKLILPSIVNRLSRFVVE